MRPRRPEPGAGQPTGAHPARTRTGRRGAMSKRPASGMGRRWRDPTWSGDLIGPGSGWEHRPEQPREQVRRHTGLMPASGWPGRSCPASVAGARREARQRRRRSRPLAPTARVVPARRLAAPTGKLRSPTVVDAGTVRHNYRCATSVTSRSADLRRLGVAPGAMPRSARADGKGDGPRYHLETCVLYIR